jgi:hypothetical protein
MGGFFSELNFGRSFCVNITVGFTKDFLFGVCGFPERFFVFFLFSTSTIN